MNAVVSDEDGLVIVGDEAYTAEEWAAMARQAAYYQRPEVKERRMHRGVA